MLLEIFLQTCGLNELLINDKNEIEISGGSETYKSIGSFIVRVNESSFFGKSLILADSKTIAERVN